MQLEINPNHIKVKFHIKKPLMKIAVGFLGTTLAISMFSGFASTVAYALENETTRIEQQLNDEYIVDIPQSAKKNICNRFGKTINDNITIKDLKSLDSMYINNIEDDMDFFKYCTNLETVIITAKNISSLEFLKNIPNLKTLIFLGQTFDIKVLELIPRLEKVTTLGIMTFFETVELNKDNIGFFENLPGLNKLNISGVYLSPDIENMLSNIEELKLGVNPTYDFDFSKLKNLKNFVNFKKLW